LFENDVQIETEIIIDNKFHNDASHLVKLRRNKQILEFYEADHRPSLIKITVNGNKNIFIDLRQNIMLNQPILNAAVDFKLSSIILTESFNIPGNNTVVLSYISITVENWLTTRLFVPTNPCLIELHSNGNLKPLCFDFYTTMKNGIVQEIKKNEFAANLVD